jgi:hypothetical protein
MHWDEEWRKKVNVLASDVSDAVREGAKACTHRQTYIRAAI